MSIRKYVRKVTVNEAQPSAKMDGSQRKEALVEWDLDNSDLEDGEHCDTDFTLSLAMQIGRNLAPVRAQIDVEAAAVAASQDEGAAFWRPFEEKEIDVGIQPFITAARSMQNPEKDKDRDKDNDNGQEEINHLTAVLRLFGAMDARQPEKKGGKAKNTGRVLKEGEPSFDAPVEVVVVTKKGKTSGVAQSAPMAGKGVAGIPNLNTVSNGLPATMQSEPEAVMADKVRTIQSVSIFGLSTAQVGGGRF